MIGCAGGLIDNGLVRSVQEGNSNQKTASVSLPHLKELSEKLQSICCPYNIRKKLQKKCSEYPTTSIEKNMTKDITPSCAVMVINIKMKQAAP